MKLGPRLGELDRPIVEIDRAVDLPLAGQSERFHGEGGGKGRAGFEGLLGQRGGQLQVAPIDEAQHLCDAQQQHRFASGLCQGAERQLLDIVFNAAPLHIGQRRRIRR